MWVLFVALVGAVLSLVAIFVVWRKFGKNIASDELPRNVQLVIQEVRAESRRELMQAKVTYDAEIADIRQAHAEEITRSNKRITELEQLVAYLTAQLLVAGGKPMPVHIPQMEMPEKRTVVVLGLWPSNSDLNTRAEIDKVFSSGIQYISMDGNVSKRTVVSALERERPAILHFGGHATEEGTEFDDGTALIGWWSNIAQRFPFRLVFLNACSSLTIVDAMSDAGVVAVVGTRGEIKDTVALEFAGEFYNRLMRGQSVGEAAALAKLTMEHIDAELIAVRDTTNWKIEKG